MKQMRIGFLLPNYSRESKSHMPRVMRALAERGVVVDVIHPIEMDDVTRARRLVVTAPSLSARDALHLAVMQRRGIHRILTFDRAFDGIVGIERIGA